MTYAAGTSVTVEASKAELERLLTKAGATQRVLGTDDLGGFAFVMCAISGRQVRLRVPLPKRDDPKWTAARRTSRLTPEDQAFRAWDQACRERWRVMVLLVKAKLEAIELGLSTVEREFLADVMLPDGRTVHEEIMQVIAGGYETGKMPPLLGMGGP